MPSLNINNLIVKKPIIQGGMGVGISMSGLASAVTNEGGIGVISSVAFVLIEDDLTIIQSPVGLPGRAIRNRFIDEVSAGERKPFQCPWKYLKT
jgi:NAD(P)H-dependent flavin oxidoreductase YrpB (nitropropane dioxygenase family)